MKKKSIAIIILFLTSSLSANTLIATVNGQNITTSVAGSEFLKLRKELRDINIQRLIDKEVAIQLSLKSDIIKSEKFKKSFDHVLKMSKRGLNPKQQTLKEALKKVPSLDSEQLRSKKGLLAFDLLLDKKAKELQPTNEALQLYYTNNFVKYNTPQLYEISTIVVKDEKTANKILAEIKGVFPKAKAFHDMAKKYSLAPNAKEGGYLGQYDISLMNKTLASIVKTLKMGQYTPKAVETEFGYEIVYLIGKTQKKNRSFEEAKANVKNDFIQDNVLEWAYSEVKRLKEKSKIVISSR